MIFSSRNYAIGMAHHQIAGGTRTLLLLCGGYIAIASAVMGLTLYNVPAPQLTMAMRAMATFFLVVEAFMLILFGSVRVAGCIRTDITTNMLESHRQMPVSAWRAVLGYMLGSTTHLMAVVTLNILALAIMSVIAHVALPDFVTAQVVLVVFALWMWSFAAMVTLMFRQGMPLMVFGFAFAMIAAMILRNFSILPGVSLLASPFLGETIFSISGGLVNLRKAYAIALPAQAAFGAIFFIGACRRYRGSYLTTLNVPLGLALVAVWGTLTAVAIRVWPATAQWGRNFGDADSNSQVVAGLAVAGMLMIVPVQALAAWESRHRVAAPLRFLALAAAVLVGAISIIGVPPSWLWGLTLLVLAAHVAIVYQGLRILRGMTPMTVMVMMIVLIFAVWLLPILMELARWVYLENNRPEESKNFSVLSTLSPLGLLITAWNRMPGDFSPVSPWPGLIWQWLLAGGLGLLARKRARVLEKEAALEAAPAAA